MAIVTVNSSSVRFATDKIFDEDPGRAGLVNQWD